MFRSAVAVIAVLLGSTTARAQTGSSPPGGGPTWLPGISVGAGFTGVGTQSQQSFESFAGSVRVELLRHLFIEGEWTSPAHASEYFETGDVDVRPLNGQLGIDGRETRNTQYDLRMAAVNVVGKASSRGVSGYGGIGIGGFDSSTVWTRTRTGCTGPWVIACEHGNGETSTSDSGHALLLVGGLDVNVLPRVDLSVSGRLGGSRALEESALTIGVRTTLVPDRRLRGLPAGRVEATDALDVRRGEDVWITHGDGTEDHGTLVSSSAGVITVRAKSRIVSVPVASLRSVETPDSIASGMLWGAAVGVGAGVFLRGYANKRALPASVLIGAGLGAVFDGLTPGRRIRYAASSPTEVRLVPAVSAGVAALGLRVAWP